VTIPVWRVKEILAANRNGEKVESIAGDSAPAKNDEPTYRTEEDSITRFDKSKKRKKKRNNKAQSRTERAPKEDGDSVANAAPQQDKAADSAPQSDSPQTDAPQDGNSSQGARGRQPHRGRNN
jgi:hypothetical protein